MAGTSYKKTYQLGDRTINRMGYGAMRITGEGTWGPPADKKEALRVLSRAVELGVNFIDTADSYGPGVSEELIAEALYPYPKDLVIATKGGFTRTGPHLWHINCHPDHLEKALHESLKRLKVDQIELYQLHRVDPEVPFAQSLEFLQKIQEEGLVKYIGLSEVSIQNIEEASKYVKVVSIQNKYSFDYRKWDPELEYCEKNNIAFIPWYPLNANKPESISKLGNIAKKYGASPYQIALSWLLHRSPNILLIPGTSKVKHLEENMKAADLVLEQEDIELLNQLP
ncbi:MAG TPA: aldo/keto reductase [Parasegetibacter sp.]